MQSRMNQCAYLVRSHLRATALLCGVAALGWSGTCSAQSNPLENLLRAIPHPLMRPPRNYSDNPPIYPQQPYPPVQYLQPQAQLQNTSQYTGRYPGQIPVPSSGQYPRRNQFAVPQPDTKPPDRVTQFQPNPDIKPSFPCERAQTPSEIAICRNPDLALLDQKVAAAFSAARQASSEQPGGPLTVEQKAWQTRRDTCASNQPCLRGSMTQRIAELQGETPTAGCHTQEPPRVAGFDSDQHLRFPVRHARPAR